MQTIFVIFQQIYHFMVKIGKSNLIYLGYVWFPENTKERKKNVKENDFFMFGCTMKNIKENKI